QEGRWMPSGGRLRTDALAWLRRAVAARDHVRSYTHSAVQMVTLRAVHGRCYCDPLRCLLLSLRADAMKRRSRAGGKPAKARPRNALTAKGRNAPKPVSHLGSASAGRTEIARLSHELNEALEQHAATAE